MKVLAIVRANLVRASRDRTALFFSVLLPLVLILVLGLTYGSGTSARIGVVDADGGALAARLLTEVQATPEVTVDLRRFDSPAALRDAASRGIVEVGLEIPAGYTAAIMSGEQASLTVVSAPTAVSTAVRTIVDRAIAAQAAIVRAARFSAALTGGSPDAALEDAAAVAASLPGVAVVVQPVNAADTGRNGYDAGAQGMLVLFMFLTSLTGAVELVITRQLGISRRMFSTPTGMRTIIFGESLARIAFALLQGLFIVAASTLLFGVRWGDPLGVLVLVVAFAVVAGGAAMIVGSLASNPSQAGALAPALAMLLGLLGGAMVPASIFPETMQTLSRLTPHAWVLQGLQAVSEPGAGVASVLPELAVLGGFAVVFFGIAILRFRRALQRG